MSHSWRLLEVWMMTVTVIMSSLHVPMVSAASRSSSIKEHQLHRCRMSCNSLIGGAVRDCADSKDCESCWTFCVTLMETPEEHRTSCQSRQDCDIGCRKACSFWSVDRSSRQHERHQNSINQLGKIAHKSNSSPTDTQEKSTNTELSTDASTRAQTSDSSKESKATAEYDKYAASSLQQAARHQTDSAWQLQLIQMESAISLVSASLRWSPLVISSAVSTASSSTDGGPGFCQQYMVVWELVSGGLRGHMLLEDTSATLSLWPNEHYNIQVMCGEVASERLMVDTHIHVKEVPEKKAHVQLAVSLLAAAGLVLIMAIAAVVLVVVAVGKRCMTGRNKQLTAKLVTDVTWPLDQSAQQNTTTTRSWQFWSNKNCIFPANR